MAYKSVKLVWDDAENIMDRLTCILKYL